jgi:hypothetical protein
VCHEAVIQTVRGMGYRLNLKALVRRAGPPVTVFLMGLFFAWQSQADWFGLIVGDG